MATSAFIELSFVCVFVNATNPAYPDHILFPPPST